jgi:hypothetical protein
VFGDAKKAARDILACIAARPQMAEFWCLMGDIYYSKRQYVKAKSLYDNAIIAGKERKDDTWPVDLSKYDEYPNKMIDYCKQGPGLVASA